MTTAIPYLCVQDAAGALDFYTKAFGATEALRLSEPGGKVGHAEIRIDGARMMLSDEYPDYGVLSPKTLGGAGMSIHLNVDDVDAFVARAVAAGATLKKPPEDQFYGERTAKLEDPFGHTWQVTTTIEEVSVEEMQRRYDALIKG